MRYSLKMVWTQGPFRLSCLISKCGVHSVLSVTTRGEVPSWVPGGDPRMLGVPSTLLNGPLIPRRGPLPPGNTPHKGNQNSHPSLYEAVLEPGSQMGHSILALFFLLAS